MTMNHSVADKGLFLALALCLPCHVGAQSNPSGKAAPSLREFFQQLVDRYNPSSLPKNVGEERLRVMHQAEAIPPDEISKALPAIFAALAHKDDQVKLYACGALIAISLRPDGAALLKTHIKPIGDLLSSPNGQLQKFGVIILGYLKPSPPPEAAVPMLAFLRRTDALGTAQAGAVGFLISNAPDNQENVEAVLDFLDRPLDRETRIATLNALATPQVKNVNIIDRVIASLNDRDSGIRFTAADVLPRMGRHALLLAQPALERLAEDPNQPADVKEEVGKALGEIRRLSK